MCYYGLPILKKIASYIYTVRVKKTFPKSFNTIPFRFTKERTIWNDNVVQRCFIPFRLVWFGFVSFCLAMFIDASVVSYCKSQDNHSEEAKAITSLVPRSQDTHPMR